MVGQPLEGREAFSQDVPQPGCAGYGWLSQTTRRLQSCWALLARRSAPGCYCGCQAAGASNLTHEGRYSQLSRPWRSSKANQHTISVAISKKTVVSVCRKKNSSLCVCVCAQMCVCVCLRSLWPVTMGALGSDAQFCYCGRNSSGQVHACGPHSAAYRWTSGSSRLFGGHSRGV